ncbi:hypothetical protein OAG63_01405 [Methylacidiphilales bacterium]|nr:hypothetical protein [Candidatus Methylacidiphilales bacterium]
MKKADQGLPYALLQAGLIYSMNEKEFFRSPLTIVSLVVGVSVTLDGLTRSSLLLRSFSR